METGAHTGELAWLFCTTGVAEIDYLIADNLTLPQSLEAHFTETVWRLPETRLCFTAPQVDVPVSALPALKNGYVTFGCFSNLAKVSDEVVALWARVLRTVADSRLLLKAKQLNDPVVRQRMLDAFAHHGIGAERVQMERAVPRAEYLEAYHRIDIVLDSFPFPGGTTTAEALWMGVPVLTLSGDCFLARQGVGLLSNAGLHDWIADNVDDYVARAAIHTGDLNRLSAVRTVLRKQVLAFAAL